MSNQNDDPMIPTREAREEKREQWLLERKREDRQRRFLLEQQKVLQTFDMRLEDIHKNTMRFDVKFEQLSDVESLSDKLRTLSFTLQDDNRRAFQEYLSYPYVDRTNLVHDVNWRVIKSLAATYGKQSNHALDIDSYNIDVFSKVLRIPYLTIYNEFKMFKYHKPLNTKVLKSLYQNTTTEQFFGIALHNNRVNVSHTVLGRMYKEDGAVLVIEIWDTETAVSNYYQEWILDIIQDSNFNIPFRLVVKNLMSNGTPINHVYQNAMCTPLSMIVYFSILEGMDQKQIEQRLANQTITTHVAIQMNQYTANYMYNLSVQDMVTQMIVRVEERLEDMRKENGYNKQTYDSFIKKNALLYGIEDSPDDIKDNPSADVIDRYLHMKDNPAADVIYGYLDEVMDNVDILNFNVDDNYKLAFWCMEGIANRLSTVTDYKSFTKTKNELMPAFNYIQKAAQDAPSRKYNTVHFSMDMVSLLKTIAHVASLSIYRNDPDYYLFLLHVISGVQRILEEKDILVTKNKRQLN